jgi:transposase InsO family protein
VSKKSVAASMARQGLVGRATRRRFRSLTRPDKAAAPAPDLIKREFTAAAINVKWCGDLTEVPTDEGKLYLAHVEDLASRRIPGFSATARPRSDDGTAVPVDGYRFGVPTEVNLTYEFNRCPVPMEGSPPSTASK